HSIHTPTVHRTSRLEDVVIHTPLQGITNADRFNLTFRIQGQGGVLLQLEQNSDILPQDAHIQYLDRNGAVQRAHPLDDDRTRVLKGDVWVHSNQTHHKAGRARVYMVQDGGHPLFKGSLSLFQQQFHVKLVSPTGRNTTASGQEKEMMLFEETSEQDPLHGDTSLIADSRAILSPRQFSSGYDFTNSIGSTAGCPTSRRVALIGLAADCSFRAAFNSAEETRRELISMVNAASEVFERRFNVSLGIRNLTISDETCPETGSDATPWNVGCASGDLDWRLQQFSTWRGAQDATNAYWTLMTNCPTGNVVGVSLVGELCNPNRGANVVVRTSNQWQVFAHESGHIFGAIHDCESTTCSSSPEQCCPLSRSTCDANGQYIMNPSSTLQQTDFSPCSIGNICSLMESQRVRTDCLVSPNAAPTTITAGECGNGIVEAGEDCDCGDNCDDNACCNGETCQFATGAVCDDAAGPCCTGCQFANASTICRPGTGPCDIQETCTGRNSDCPADRHVSDGQSCGNSSSLFCASGECTSRDLQCRDTFNGLGTAVSSCDDASCQLYCSVEYGSGSYCRDTGRDVLDGMPCRGGVCQGGRCQNSQDSGSGGSSWFDRHRSLVIGIVAGVGGGLLLGVVIVILCACCRRRERVTKESLARVPNTSAVSSPPMNQTVYHGPDRGAG
ncbi:zincin, partial [Aspergillus sclerotioniger CBS 115572]